MQSLVRELEYRLKEKGERLEGYEQLETELDDVVLQAAKSKNERGEGDRIVRGRGKRLRHEAIRQTDAIFLNAHHTYVHTGIWQFGYLKLILCQLFRVSVIACAFVCVNDMTRFDMHKVKRAGRRPIVYYTVPSY